jgi:RND family efflux transporter MFP subunit
MTDGVRARRAFAACPLVAALWLVAAPSNAQVAAAGRAETADAKTSAAEPPAAAAPVRVLLIPARETTVVAQMVGRVDRLGGELGDSVALGAPLVVFDCGEQKAREGIADAELSAARQQLDTKSQLKSLNAAGESEVQLAATAVDRARAQLDLARHQASHCRIDAPFAGRIVKLHVRQFQSTSVGQPLVELVATGPLKLRLNAPSRWLSWLRRGTAFRIEVDETGRSYAARVTAINGRVDAASQSVEVEGAVTGMFPELLAGMSGNARFKVPR